MRPLDKIRNRLSAVKENQDGGYIARCPVTDSHKNGDKTPSLSVSEGEGGKVLLHCFAGCSYESIVRALGMETKDLFPEEEQRERRCSLDALAGARRIEAAKLKEFGLYDAQEGVGVPYYAADRTLMFLKTRTRVNGPKHYICTPGAKLDLYGLWRIPAEEKRDSIVIVEGESDCWTLWSQGFPAIGVPGSTNLKPLRNEEPLRGFKRIFIARERDEAGSKFAIAVKEMLEERGQKAFVLDLDAKDVSELYMRNPPEFKAKFIEACKNAMKDPTANGGMRSWELMEFLRAEHEPVKYMIEQVLPTGLVLFYGPGKMGKSRLMTDFYLSVIYGGGALGKYAADPAGGLYMDWEDREWNAKERITAIKGELGAPPNSSHLWFGEPVSMDDNALLLRVEKHLDEFPDTRLVIIDTLDNVWPSRSARKFGNARDAEAEALRKLRSFAHRYGLCLVAMHHPSKHEGVDDLSDAAGTTAFISVPDAILKLKRERGKRAGVLTVTGRGIREQTINIVMDDAGVWCLEGHETALPPIGSGGDDSWIYGSDDLPM